jgi:heptosyltransferase-2
MLDNSTPGPLVIRLCNWVGEAVLALPALLALEQQGHQLHLVGKRWAVDLFAGHGWPVLVRPAKRSEAIAQLKQLRTALSRQDAGFNKRVNTVLLTNSLSSALECRLAGLRSIGFSVEARGFLLAKGVPRRLAPHVADEYWTIAQALLNHGDASRPSQLGLKTSATQLAEARQRLLDAGVAGTFILICPFSGEADTTGKKVWPHFQALCAELSQHGHQVVICPGPGEEASAKAQFSQAVILESVRLGTYAAISRLSSATVANDTGPAHLAAAVNASLVSVLGPDAVPRWYPLGPHVAVLRKPSGWPSQAEVLASVNQATSHRPTIFS